MNILILGSGGREHSIACAVKQNPKCRTLFVAPGNAGISEIAACVPVDINNPDAVVHLAKEKSIDFVIIGPEMPLAKGVSDYLRHAGFCVFGPSAAAAKLETSKHFAKKICRSAGVPTANFDYFNQTHTAKYFLQDKSPPFVIKVDGLAGGKGVTVAHDHKTAEEAIEAAFCFGAADDKSGLLIEEFLPGEEASFFVLCDGENTLPIGTAQDHKRVGDGDRGPNTGGMGAFSPATNITPDVEEKVLRKIIQPTISELRRQGITYQGVLYAGLMINEDDVHLVEYNVRFGDPEAQVLMFRLGGQILDLLLLVASHQLKNAQVHWADDHAISVVLANRGYPLSFSPGSVIRGLDTLPRSRQAICFHAGTAKRGEEVVAVGGRVLNATARAATLKEAHALAYGLIDSIDWPEGFCRRDIGRRALATQS
ncbi:MAG: phosphoribosylamine--glycine ligase [Aestuariivita sp.]|nr:phosphoribosylamine--glycine ligase [Aestuariivita sp.]MCY4202824.1 phosphoribosylamine--glycine ligase [Aestuariivita sp.]